jgi:hypothetical protein
MIQVPGTGRSRGWQHPPRTLGLPLRFQLAPEVRDSSVTAHCPAATAWLIREYQGDYRRQFLISTAAGARHPLDNPFHIKGGDKEGE